MPALRTTTLTVTALALATVACSGETRLARDLRSGDGQLAARAAYAAGQRGRATPAEQAALLDNTMAPPQVALGSIWALGELPREVPGRRAHLLEALRRPEARVAALACWALARCYPQDEAVRAALRELARDERDLVRTVATGALERFVR